jgi:iron complex transport system substrate-binding protein
MPPERIVIAGRANFFLNDAAYLFPQAPERVVALTQARQTSAIDPDATPFVALLDPDYGEKVILTSESTAEEIATAQPDVVLLKRFMRESLGDPLETLGIPVVYLDLETPEQYQRDIGVLGAIFGEPDRAQAIWDYYEARIATVERRLADLPDADRPTLLLLQYNSRGAEIALEVPPPDYIQTTMARMAKADTLWLNATQSGGWSVVNLEQIAAWNPDKIVVISYFDPVDEVVSQLTSDPNWQGLAAVQNDEVYGFPIDYYSWDQPDTRWILGLTWLAQTMHPEQLSDIDIGDEILTLYGELYGLDAETVEAEIYPLLQGDIVP